jgi:WD40 repeat protein
MVKIRVQAHVLLLALLFALVSFIASVEARDRNTIIYALEYSPNGSYIAVGRQGCIDIVHSDTDESVVHLEIPSASGFHTISWASDSNRLAAGSESGDLVIFDVEQEQNYRLQDSSVSNFPPITTVDWRQDGHEVAFISPSYREILVGVAIVDGDMTHSENIRFVVTNTGDLVDIAWSPDSSVLALSTTDEGILLLNPARDLITPLGYIVSGQGNLAWSRDSSQLAMTATSVTIWNIAEQRMMVELRPSNHEAIVDLDWSVDGRFIAFSTVSGSIELWRTSSWERIEDFEPRGAEFTPVALSPNGEWLSYADSNHQLAKARLSDES